MYDVIAELYSRIFPPDSSRCGFITAEAGLNREKSPAVLDIGCATGDLAFELAEQGCTVSGIDLDEKMIEIAVDRAAGTGNTGDYPGPDFRCAGMTDIAEIFKPASFNAAVCFGNTLPHLPSADDVEDFFSQVYSLLNKGGSFIFQIINFDMIAESQSFEFPDIILDIGIFKRKYIRREDGRLNFIISLENSSSEILREGSVPLLPLTKSSLLPMLKKTGFSSIRIFSGYDRRQAKGDETASIFSMKKL